MQAQRSRNHEKSEQFRMKSILLKSAYCLLLANLGLASDIVPGPPQTQPIALVDGTVYPVSGAPLESGVVLFDKGKITAIGSADQVQIPANAKVISITGQRVYPSLFEAHSSLGLVEIPSVRASVDDRETGSINSNVRAYVSVNPDSELIPVARANGVLLALSAPEGGLISGQSSVLQLDGWTSEDLTLKHSVGMVINWPSVKDDLEESGTGHNRIDELRDLFDEVRAYEEARKAEGATQKTDLKLESLLPVIHREIPLHVWADGLSTIQSAVAFAAEQEVKLVIFGASDAPHCADLLKQHGVPVVVSAVYRLPRRRNDAYDSAYTLPARLHAAGVRFCISGSATSRNSSNSRNLPYHAGMAVAFGLPYEDALKAITLWPAEILGVADRVGSLELGKDATLIVTTGDPLEIDTEVQHAWVQGRAVDLHSRHTQLYEKYQQKYQQAD